MDCRKFFIPAIFFIVCLNFAFDIIVKSVDLQSDHIPSSFNTHSNATLHSENDGRSASNSTKGGSDLVRRDAPTTTTPTTTPTIGVTLLATTKSGNLRN